MAIVRRRYRLVRLATTLVLAQACMAALTGLPYARRGDGTVPGVLALVLMLLVLVVLLRTGTPAARNTVLLVETVAFLIGAGIFVSGGRWVGGTTFAGVVAGVLLHPAVAAAFGVSRPVSADRRRLGWPIGDRRAVPPRPGRYDRGDGRHGPSRD
ncbi:MAG: hypothetical protein GEV11_20010 [Streptosporangiales bacterium]|nr:hypothetical protein [Streptosporangiales bacterium]